MNMDPVYSIIAVVAALAVGFLLGRRTGHARARIGELESRLEAVGKERELAQASVRAAKEEIKRVETELREYRADVVEHFTGTSGLLRDLTVRYRSVYDHLTKGATSLCPEGSVDLLEGMQSERLLSGTDPSDPASDGDGATEEAARSQGAPPSA